MAKKKEDYELNEKVQKLYQEIDKLSINPCIKGEIDYIFDEIFPPKDKAWRHNRIETSVKELRIMANELENGMLRSDLGIADKTLIAIENPTGEFDTWRFKK